MDPGGWRAPRIVRTLDDMPNEQATSLKLNFDKAFSALASARAAYEDEPRSSQRVAALGAARILLDDARSAMEDERRRLGLDAPWRVEPAPVDHLRPPPLWSVDHGANA